MKNGSINLAQSIYLPAQGGRQANRNVFSVQMNSTNLSAETAFNLQLSADGVAWANATDPGGSDLAGSLKVNTPKVVSYEIDNNLMWRIKFASGNTGVIDFVILD